LGRSVEERSSKSKNLKRGEEKINNYKKISRVRKGAGAIASIKESEKKTRRGEKR